MVAGRVSIAVSALFLCLLLLAGCESTPPAQRFADIRFTHLSPIRLNVAELVVETVYQPPVRPPNVEHRFPVSPARAAEIWAQDRLKTAGVTDVARFQVTEASVVEVPLSRTGGLRGAFTTDQTDRYDAVLAVQLEILTPAGSRKGAVNVRVTRSRSVPEGITLNDRERAWFELTEALMRDLNAELETQIRRHFADFMT